MWSARTKEMVPPSITATGAQPFRMGSRISAPVVSLYSAMRLPSESNTEWIVTGVGEVRVRIAWRPMQPYVRDLLSSFACFE
jgi:hypothetical protein